MRHIPTDENFRIRTSLLVEALEQDLKNGLTPFCVTASAGAVMTGAIDPIPELSELCRAKEMWLHIDGAYGALAALSKRFEMIELVRLAALTSEPNSNAIE